MEPIAIVGLGCLFPGARTPDEFWDNLLAGRDSVSEATAEQMGVDAAQFFDATSRRVDTYSTLRGGFVHDFRFDPHGYRIAPERLAELDPLFQWSLYVARSALADSGYLDRDDQLARCGLLLGNLSFPTRTSQRLLAPIYNSAVEAALSELLPDTTVQLPRLPPHAEPALVNGLLGGYPAAVVAGALGLGGARLALDAACSSSLYAVKLACAYLNSGQADMMLAGAVSCADPLFVMLGFSIFQAYPSTGDSRPLDRTSTGLTSGEGAGMLVLKRYTDAVRDGDTIYAAIRGVGLSNDGAGKHLLVPNPKGQHLAYERAYAGAGVDPASIDYVECHATGTPIGDITELNGLEAFFGTAGHTPLIGSVKSNFGHLLTAAGMAGVIKTVLSLVHGVIPPTINVDQPLASHHGSLGAHTLVREPTAWPAGHGPRRAAVSGFGFGGTNAHVILEGARPEPLGETAHMRDRPQTALAIVGMDACFSHYDGLDDFERGVAAAVPALRPAPAQRWDGIRPSAAVLGRWSLEGDEAPRGGYIEDFELDFLRAKAPPSATDQPIPQQLLMLKVADRALRDAGLQPGADVAVVIAMGTDLTLHRIRARVDLQWQLPQALKHAGITLAPDDLARLQAGVQGAIHDPAQVNQYISTIGNIIACRIASLWDFTGPAFTVSAEESSVFRALEVAQLLLAAREVEAVVVGAVDLAGSIESVLLHSRVAAQQHGADGDGQDGARSAWTPVDGAGAVVLRRQDAALAAGQHIYAIIEALSFAPTTDAQAGQLPRSPSVDRIVDACSRAMHAARVGPADIGYLEMSASGTALHTAAETVGLGKAYQLSGNQPSCAVGSMSANIGDAWTVSSMAGLIRTALALDGRYLPATPDVRDSRSAQLWQATSFYLPDRTRPWFAGRAPRRAAINCWSQHGDAAHLILAQGPTVHRQPSRLHVHSSLTLLPIAAHDLAELVAGIEKLAERLDAGASLVELSRGQLEMFRKQSDAPYALALLAGSPAELRQELAAARSGVPQAFAQMQPWTTPAGSYFTPRPLGRHGAIAFVYPGAFNSYLDMGRQLFQLFPALHERMQGLVSDVGRAVGDAYLYPRWRGRPSGADIDVAKQRLRTAPVAMIETGTGLSVALTSIVRDTFGLRPDMALGYSMGEASMLWALGVWHAGDAGGRRLHRSPLFTERLVGRCDAGRTYLGEPPGSQQPFWTCYVAYVPAATARERLRSEQRAFLTQINTPHEVVIAGAAADVERVIADLGCDAAPLPFVGVLHCRAMRSEYDALVALHTLPTAQVAGVTFYSSAEYAPLASGSLPIAQTLARSICEPVDFPRLVQRAYDDGARVFVELGPGGTCTRWIGDILQQREHAATAVNQRGTDDDLALHRVLAKLVGHRVELDLSPLVPPQRPGGSAERPARKALVKTVVLGGKDHRGAIVNDDHRRLLEAGRVPSVRQNSRTQQPVAAGDHAAVAPHLHHGANRAAALSASAPLARPDGNMTSSHAAFLADRIATLRTMSAGLNLASHSPLAAPTPPRPPASPARDRAELHQRGWTPTDAASIVWDEDELLEFAGGSISKVFGPEYAVIDRYARRVRLPNPPYLLVTRVTQLDATRGSFTPSAITTEYDIPGDAWYGVDGQIPMAVAVESGQCDLMLISYLGIDFECRGERVYRLLDCTLTFLADLPRAGQTLRYDIRINSFARSGDTLLFYFSYRCYAGDSLILTMDGGCAGFFSDAELEQGRGVVDTQTELRARHAAVRRQFAPLLHCDRTSFDRHDLQQLSAGNLASCFGPAYDQRGLNRSLRLAPPALLMIDRITQVDSDGGAWGLGLLVAEHDLAPQNWYFPCHFKDDQVLAGSLIAEGCCQLLQFYMLFLGLQTQTFDARFQPVAGVPQVVRCRGQVTPRTATLIYRMEVTDLKLVPRPSARANVDIVLDGQVIVRFKDLALQLGENNPRVVPPLALAHARNGAELYSSAQITEFAVGSLTACFGDMYAVYDGRRAPRTPNGQLQLISRVVAATGRQGSVVPGATLRSEYDVPASPWFCHASTYPTAPYAILMELGLQPCGFLSAHLGTTLENSGQDLYFRNLDGHGVLLHEVDIRGKTVANSVKLRSSTSLDGIIIQAFEFALECDGAQFFQGDAVFGYFTPQALAKQTGLDSGRLTRPWYAQPGPAAARNGAILEPIDRHLYHAAQARPHERLAHSELNLLERLVVDPSGGLFGQGYAYAERTVDPNDWYFACHFLLDPVMPGSLGVEAMLQAVQAFALQTGLTRSFRSPRFGQVGDHQTTWKYRGQIVPSTGTMALEVHINRVEHRDQHVVVIGDANLWRDGLRIYQVQNLALAIIEAVS